jgi:hypothetical protein
MRPFLISSILKFFHSSRMFLSFQGLFAHPLQQSVLPRIAGRAHQQAL